MKVRIPVSQETKKRMREEVLKEVSGIEERAGVRAQLMLLYAIRDEFRFGTKRMNRLFRAQERLVPMYSKLISDGKIEAWISEQLSKGKIPDAEETLKKINELVETEMLKMLTDALKIRDELVANYFDGKAGDYERRNK